MAGAKRWRPKSFKMYLCEDCRKADYGNHFATYTLCKQCAAKRRRERPKATVAVSADISVTSTVAFQLRQTAESDVLHPKTERFYQRAVPVSMIAFWGSAPFVAPLFFKVYSEGYWLFFAAWAFLPLALVMAEDLLLGGARRKRRLQVEARILELAQRRQEKLQEQERFYSSPEWIALRNTVVREEGNVCAQCGKRIWDDSDLSVDHKKPRSKYPELALKRDNLQVLCRQCNSRKGAKD